MKRKIDKETANYVLTYYSHLLSAKEKMAIVHTRHSIKIESRKNNPAITEMYKSSGWLTDDQTILDLLRNGYDNFELLTAQRILESNDGNVFLNYCANCGRLARTPDAKQCRHCGNDWHVR